MQMLSPTSALKSTVHLLSPIVAVKLTMQLLSPIIALRSTMQPGRISSVMLHASTLPELRMVHLERMLKPDLEDIQHHFHHEGLVHQDPCQCKTHVQAEC
jgi:hypothetical protein